MSIKPILAPRNEQRLGLVMTPQMRQRIEMLSMTRMEMEEVMTSELSTNPVLEEVAPNEPAEGLTVTDEALAYSDPTAAGIPGDDGPTPEYTNGTTTETTGSAPDSGESEAAAPPETGEAEDGGEPTEVRDPFDEIDFGSTFENYLDPGYKTVEYEDRGEQPSFENFLTRKPTLLEHLQWQLNLTRLTPDLKAAAEAVVASLDDNGFLADSVEEIAAIGPWPVEVVERARTLVQQLDPVGIGSKNVIECFLVQLKYKGHENRLACTLVRDYFNRLQQYRWPDLAKELGVTIEDIAREVSLISKLEPFPGRQFTPDEAQPIQPEVFIEKIDDEYYIRFDDDGMPQLRINSNYRRLLENDKSSKEEREYVRECFRSAVDLLKNIEHRRQTIYRVCEAIVQEQRAFLDGGIMFLKPMMLKDLAERIGIHLSTVSRVVNRKYAHTPQGVIELRRFFTDGMTNDSGEEVSTQLLKLQIKKMIEEEDPHNPLTDDEIMRRMGKTGIKLSRRTVAKYRDQMSIPGSRERRTVI